MAHYNRICAEINLDAVLSNIENIHKLIDPSKKIFAVVKADGYGNGAVEISRTLEPLDYIYGFCVATIEEGIELREHHIRKPILILGYVFPDQYPLLIDYNLMTTVFTTDMAKLLSDIAVANESTIHVHVKVDTGMNRIGVPINDKGVKIIQEINNCPGIAIDGIFTHFARADETDKTYAKKQFEKFRYIIDRLEALGLNIPIKHCANSASIIDLPECQMDMVRAGIILYGLTPSKEVHSEQLSLTPVLTLKSHISYLKYLPSGTQISYGGTAVLTRNSIVATIPVGYGDGYPRSLSNKGYVLIKGKKAPILGRICMDQFMVDVTDIPDTEVGDEVVLIGESENEKLTLDALADLSQRFNYEFSCDLGKRIPRIFLKNNEIISTKDYFCHI